MEIVSCIVLMALFLIEALAAATLSKVDSAHCFNPRIMKSLKGLVRVHKLNPFTRWQSYAEWGVYGLLMIAGGPMAWLAGLAVVGIDLYCFYLSRKRSPILDGKAILA